ncbi:translation initiation factor IF-1 [Candidatus Pacearchaeota archaeon]|jgi:translation initiation factor IF-1|nr:translation initiation factor IF-1 [Candidatus Pacearchaeota archaeon]
MPKGDLVEIEGTIAKACGGGLYDIQPDKGGAVIQARLCGQMKQRHIRVLPGDKVKVGISPYDLTHGLIQWRFK